VIAACCSAAIASSTSGAWPSRMCNARNMASAGCPLAQMMNVKPNRRAYSRLPACSAASVPLSAPRVPSCSCADHVAVLANLRASSAPSAPIAG
jgi:hypothetical protein